MVRLRLWLGLSLGLSVALAVSCSSNDVKTPQNTAPSGGADDEGGAGSNSLGGNTTEAGAPTTPGEGGAAPSSTGGQSAGGESASAMTDGWLSGTRLRAIVLTSGTAHLFQGWHDSELDVDCSFGADANGDQRCLPEPLGAYGAFSDDKCMKPVVVYEPTYGLPKYIADPSVDEVCNVGRHYLAVGAKSAVAQVFARSGSDCLPTAALTATQAVAPLGAVLAEDKLVAATGIVHEAGDTRLNANVRVAADGSREVISQLDLQRHVDCVTFPHAGDGFACVPQHRAFIDVFYTDGACKNLAALVSGNALTACNETPDIVQHSAPFFTDTYFEVGAKLTTPVHQQGAGCPVWDAPPDTFYSFYAVGKAVPFSAFPPLSSKNEGTGRILTTVLRGDAGEAVSREAFYDSKLATTCNASTAGDMTMRCLPRTLLLVNEFSDNKCTKGLVLVGTTDAAPAAGAFALANAVGVGNETFVVGAAVSTPVKTWQRNAKDCGQATPSNVGTYYAATSLAPTELAPVSTEVE